MPKRLMRFLSGKDDEPKKIVPKPKEDTFYDEGKKAKSTIKTNMQRKRDTMKELFD